MVKRFSLGFALSMLNRPGHASRLLTAIFFPIIFVRRLMLRPRISRLRKAQSLLAERLAEDPVIRLDQFSGVFVISRHSDILRRVLYEDDYESVLVRECMKHLDADRDAVDVGANIGFYAVLFAKNLPGRRVLAVEPAPGALDRLKQNIRRNGTEKNTIVFEGLASRASGFADIKIVAGKEEYTTSGELAHPSVSGQPFSVVRVRMERLDDLVRLHGLEPGLVKIDAEGGEKGVLEGAEKTLAKHRPVVVSELSDYLLRRNGSSSAEVVGMFERLGYVVVNALRPHEPPGRRDFEDVLCLPRERWESESGKKGTMSCRG